MISRQLGPEMSVRVEKYGNVFLSACQQKIAFVFKQNISGVLFRCSLCILLARVMFTRLYTVEYKFHNVENVNFDNSASASS